MTPRSILPAALLSALIGAEAAAAPFCVDVTGIPRQCLYVDPTACRQEAVRQHGQCVANANEIRTPPRSQQFCLVQAGNVMSCVYPDRADCDRDSQLLKGACMPALPEPEAAPAPAPGADPYAVKRPY